MHRYCCLLLALGALLGLPTWAQVKNLEAEDYLAPGAERFRDDRASGGKCAGAIITDGGKAVVAAKLDLPAGDYEVSFWVTAGPLAIVHHLGVTLRAGDQAVTLRQIQFSRTPGYQQVTLRCFHVGGLLPIEVSGAGGSGFDGMRKELSEEEKAGLSADLKVESTLLDAPDTVKPAVPDEALDDLEADRNVKKLKVYEHRLLCDKLAVTARRTPPVVVTQVAVDKIHYFPGETVKAAAWVAAPGGAAAADLVALDVTEVDAAREVFRQPVQVAAGEPQPIAFTYALDQTEFGHELRCELHQGGKAVHDHAEYFGVSRNVYRIGITGAGGGQDMRTYSVEQARRDMESCKRGYANYFERFAWAPCDYSNLAPEDEIFYSGQTQYPGGKQGFKNLLAEAHRVGVKGITYGKSCAGGIEGFKTLQRHPEFFGQSPHGLPTEAYNTFYLERMVANDYNLHSPPMEGGWQHWASLWCDWSNPQTVIFGAEAIMKSIEMFGWDGVRWDGHFVGSQEPFLKLLKARYPNFVHGYNIAFANPAGKMFLPPAGPKDKEDFHLVARDHGLMMDESVRDWSHTNFSSGLVRPYYEAVCREGDYIRRLGGLPLFISFDMASNQDLTFCVLVGLVAGERYTYLTSPGDFTFGSLAKFMTRYSAFVWDDTRRVADAAKVVTVALPPDEKVIPWWDHSTWLRTLPNGRQQLLVNLLNPLGSNAFCNRVQPTPKHLRQLTVSVQPPAAGKLVRTVHVSPDLAAGHVELASVRAGDRDQVSLPELRTWSIVVFEYDGAPQPAWAVTTPLEDAANFFAREDAAREAAAKKAAEDKAKAGIAPTPAAPPQVAHYQDYAKTYNADEDTSKKLARPQDMEVLRNGVFDVHHARGAFGWLNPVEAALGVLGGGNYQPSWVDMVGFKLGGGGCMDDFPDSYAALLSYDVLVLDNIHARELGATRRAMVADFVRNGGSLLIFGGLNNLSRGADHNTALAEFLPVRIRKFSDMVRNDQGLPLKIEKPDFFPGVTTAKPAFAFMVDVSPLKEGVDVLLSAGGHPAIVAQQVGKGRVVTVLMNCCGDWQPATPPYWEWSQWPRVLSCCLKWLGEGATANTGPRRQELKGDPTKIKPDELVLEGVNLSGPEFTAKLREARVNLVDAESAKHILQASVDYFEKIEDLELLADVTSRASPFFDKSFAPLGEKLVKAPEHFIRQAGYQVLGLAHEAKFRPLLELGLKEEKTELVHEALIGLIRLADPASLPAVRDYVRRGGGEKLLANCALFRMGDKGALKEALAAYDRELSHRNHLKSGRLAAYDTIAGGVSFKLTPAARKRATAEYERVCRVERTVKSDLRFFAEQMKKLSGPDAEVCADYLAQTQTPEILSFAYAVYAQLPADQAATFRTKMAAAKLTGLRLIAGE